MRGENRYVTVETEDGRTVRMRRSTVRRHVDDAEERGEEENEDSEE